VAVSPALGQTYIAQAFMTVVTGGPAFVSGTIVSSALLATVGNAISQATTTLWGVTGLLITAMVLVRLLPLGLSASWRRKF
jgi:branched-chain amino acid transport system permease protein